MANLASLQLMLSYEKQGTSQTTLRSKVPGNFLKYHLRGRLPPRNIALIHKLQKLRYSHCWCILEIFFELIVFL